jgi:uncharacterized protein involved in exopolysaccharide biosynthesis
MSIQQQLKTPKSPLSLIPQFVWQYKIFILSLTFFCSALMVVYAINKPNVYTVQGLYMPKGTEEGGTLAKLAGQFGGLASMAGVNLGGGSTDKTAMAIELLKSRAFLQAFIDKYDLKVALLAVERWDKAADRLVINAKLYDENTKQWIRKVPEGKSVIPTAWEAYAALADNLVIEYQSKKSILSIKLSYYSPDIAALWLTNLVKEVNFFWKNKTERETSKTIKMLEQQLLKTNLSELKTVFYDLIGEQTKSRLLAQITDEVMFETVVGIVIPEVKSSPRRALLCMVAFILSFLVATLSAVFYGLRSQESRVEH